MTDLARELEAIRDRYLWATPDKTDTSWAVLTRAIAALREPAGSAADARSARQAVVYSWCSAAFGQAHATSVAQRGLRLAEEAVEVAQAAGVDLEQLLNLVRFVYSRPVGELGQELGGVGVTVLALAAAADLDAETEEAREVARVLSKPLSHFHARNEAKNAAGFDANAYPVGEAS